MAPIDIILFIIVLTIVMIVVFSVRAIVLRKNAGCGAIALIGLAIPFVLLYFTFNPPNSHKDLFKDMFGYEYPNSAICIKKEHQDGWIDYAYGAIIKTDTTSYNKLLRIIQSDSIYRRRDTEKDGWDGGGIGFGLLRDTKIKSEDLEFIYSIPTNHHKVVGFHKNKQIIIYEKFRN